MSDFRIRLTLESDGTFGRGSGIPGLIDQDIVLDRYGCPYLHGRTLKGLLSEVCSEILYAVPGSNANAWMEAADALFGRPGSTLAGQGVMRIGHARLPEELRSLIQHAVAHGQWTTTEVTDSLTALRHQTAVEVGGAPDPHTLRVARVILHGATFHADMHLPDDSSDEQKGLVAACVKGLRRGGLARNRGRGRLRASIEDLAGNPLSDDWFQAHFKTALLAPRQEQEEAQ